MAFNLQSWGLISGAANNRVVTLQNNTFIGAPNVCTYVSASDTISTIEAANYFANVAVDLSVGDLIYAVGSDAAALLTVSTISFNPFAITISVVAGSGNVVGPGSSTNNDFVLFNGVTGRLIKDSGFAIVPATAGGTGINNAASTITLGGSLTTVGAFASTFTMTGATGVTFPTSGTLATTSSLPTPAALTKVDDTNVTLTLGGTPATALLQATSITAGWTGQLALTRGGTNASLTASNGGIVYSTATAFAVLAATATATQMLQSGASGAPAWSTTTWPATSTINRLLYSSAANVISDLATANSATLITSAGGVPSLSQTLPSAVQTNITALGAQAQALNMNTHLINGVVDPVSAQDAATKNYVDSVASGLNPAESVVAATTANLTVVYANGVAGIGATLTNNTTLAAFSIDGQSPTVGQRVLIKDQSSALQNGIYLVTVAGSGILAWILTRALDFNTPTAINNSGIIPVINGTVNGGTGWICTSTVTTIGTDAITFTQFGVSFPVSVANGGTGLTSVAQGDMLYGSASNVYSKLAKDTNSTRYLSNTGSSNNPAWAQVAISTGVSGLGANVATWLATPTSANLATAVATTSTGSGSLVFATSPTLVTPILGTPTSGTLTNCTGYPTSALSGLGANVATWLATPTSANLATAVATTSTGSGSLVFATSPTLVTPVLGTPSSGTLTSCTGLPISTGVSGLGTGVATFLATPSSANLLTAMTTSTGTGNNVFATSPTLVTPVLGTPSSGNLSNCTSYPLQGMQLISSVVASASTTINFDNQLTSTYDMYLLVFENVILSAARKVEAQFGTGGTPTYQATGYLNQSVSGSNTTTTTDASGTTFLGIGNANTLAYTANGTNSGSGYFYITNVNQATNSQTVFGQHYFFSTPYVLSMFGGSWQGSSAVTSIQLLLSAAGTFTTGTFKLYGLKN